MENIKIYQAGDNFKAKGRGFANADGGFWQTDSSDVLDTLTVLGTTVIAAKTAKDIAKGQQSGSPQPPMNTGGSNTTPPKSMAGPIILSIVGIGALAGVIFLVAKSKKKS